MTCFDTRFQNINNNNNNNPASIVELLRRLDRMQREAIIANATHCCENCTLKAMFNTKPIAIQTCCGRFTANLGLDEENTANLFRVEAVRGNELVVLRLLKNCNGVIECTHCTVVLRIDCICSVQCFDPINCETTCFPIIL